MANLNWADHDVEIVTFVKKISNYYLRTDASTGKLLREDQGVLLRNNYATPRRIEVLVEYLRRVSDQVDGKLQAVRTACLMAQMDLEQCKAGSTTFGPIFTDYSHWDERLKGYEAETAAAIARNPDASGDEDREFWDRVTKPLLLGLYPGQEQQSKLDATTPLTMAWQIEVAKRAYRDALVAFWADLKAQAQEYADQLTNFGGSLLLLGALGLALGYGFGKGRSR
jgi:hypothetical protein